MPTETRHPRPYIATMRWADGIYTKARFATEDDADAFLMSIIDTYADGTDYDVDENGMLPGPIVDAAVYVD
jgi:hypothetical protein